MNFTINAKAFTEKFEQEFDAVFEAYERGEEIYGTQQAVAAFKRFRKSNKEEIKLVSRVIGYSISDELEIAAFVFALQDFGIHLK